MAYAADKTAVLSENLRDMGLDAQMTARCMELVRQKRYTELERLLKSYRQTLLDSVHKYNDCIDCLDYFTYTLRKNGGI